MKRGLRTRVSMCVFCSLCADFSVPRKEKRREYEGHMKCTLIIAAAGAEKHVLIRAVALDNFEDFEVSKKFEDS